MSITAQEIAKRLDLDTTNLDPALITRLYLDLCSMVNDDDRLARGWLYSRNKAFADARPVDLIINTEGLLRLIAYIERHSRSQ